MLLSFSHLSIFCANLPSHYPKLSNVYSPFCPGLLNSFAFSNIRLSNLHFGACQLPSPEQSRTKCTASEEDGVGVTALLCRTIKVFSVLLLKYFQKPIYVPQYVLVGPAGCGE